MLAYAVLQEPSETFCLTSTTPFTQTTGPVSWKHRTSFYGFVYNLRYYNYVS